MEADLNTDEIAIVTTRKPMTVRSALLIVPVHWGADAIPDFCVFPAFVSKTKPAPPQMTNLSMLRIAMVADLIKPQISAG